MSGLKHIDDFLDQIQRNTAVLSYFSYEKCSVCRVLKPKVIELIEKEFPKLTFLFIDTHEYPEISAQNQVFTVPTLIFYVEGKEYFRLGRNFGIEELAYRIERVYNRLFS